MRWRKQNLQPHNAKIYGCFWDELETVAISEERYLALFKQKKEIKKVNTVS